jgi:hypothetical protein
MNDCLGLERLLALALAEPADHREERGHLARCPSCAASYREITSGNALIVRSLEAVARSVMAAPHRKPVAAHPVIAQRGRESRERITSQAWLAAAFAGAMAAAFILMLGTMRWPSATSLTVATAASGTPQSASEVSAIPAQTTVVTAAAALYTPWQAQRTDMIFTDPTDDIGYQEAIAGTSSYQDTFDCDPLDAGTFCSQAAEQG